MLRVVVLVSNAGLLAFLVMEGLSLGSPNSASDIMYVALVLCSALSSLWYALSTRRADETIFTLWLDVKKEKMRRELHSLKKDSGT